METTLNLATQPYQDVQRFLLRWRLIIAGVALLAAILLCWSTIAYLSWHTTSLQLTELQRQIDAQDRKKAEAEAFLNRPDNFQIRQQAELLNSAFARKAFSWTEVFTDLEQVVPKDLQVTSIQPAVNNDDQFELHLAVSGSSRGAAIELVRRLEQSTHFAHAQINDEITQNSTDKQAPGEVIQYNITAIYVPNFERTKSVREVRATSQAGMPPTEVASDRDDLSAEAVSAGH